MTADHDGHTVVIPRMTPRRNRASAKAAGRKFEREVAEFFAYTLADDRIERRRQTGSKDRGDIAGLRHLGRRVVVEVKDTSAWTPSAWLTEVEIERLNDDAAVGLVVAKRRGKAWPGDAVVLMTLQDLCALLVGDRDYQDGSQ